VSFAGFLIAFVPRYAELNWLWVESCWLVSRTLAIGVL